MKLTKALIPAAGLGTRMLPAAKAIPKELLPILDRPAIQYVVEEAADAGVNEIVLITSPRKRAIEAHFAADAALSARLAKSGRTDLLASVDRLRETVRLVAIDQLEQRGLGDAVRLGREAIGNEPFLCMLGDAIFSGEPLPARQLIDAHARFGTAIVGLEEVPPERVERYGIVGGTMLEPGVYQIDQLVEKPRRDAAPSRLAIAARYLLTPEIFDCLDGVSLDASGEIQLTAALQLLLKRQSIHGVILQSRRHDIGNPVDWLAANLAFAAADPTFREALAPQLRAIFK